jgi:hypothetical protein
MSLHRPDSLQTEQLLFLLARCHLNPAQEDWMDEAVSNLKEPERFEELAKKTFVASMAYSHLSKSLVKHKQAELMARLHAQRLQTAKNYLFLKAEADLLSANLLEPAGVTHVFFKGTALADQFYKEPSMRCARDIDVLIPRRNLVSVIERGLALGYRLCADEAAMSAAERAFFLKMGEVFPLESPHGAHIEIHSQVDASGVLFDTEKMLLESEACEGFKFRRRLPSWLHVVYSCIHHTRHRWSHLHWLADLDAALSSPNFDLARTKAEALRLNLWQCVEPCLGLQEVSGRPEAFASVLAGTSNETSEVQELARASVENLGRVSNELSGGSGILMIPDFTFGWQMNAALRVRYFKWRIPQVFTPRMDDYQASPLGQRMPVFLPFVRFTRVVRRNLRRLVGKAV